MSALLVERKIAEKKLVQRFPAGLLLRQQQLRTRLHHLLHGLQEVRIRVRRVGWHRHAPVQNLPGFVAVTAAGGGGGGVGVGAFDDGVGAAGGGEEEALGGEGGGEVGWFGFGLRFDLVGGGRGGGVVVVVVESGVEVVDHD